MDLNALEKNVTLLSTPYCDFSVLDEEGNVIENKFGYFKNSIYTNINKVINNEIEWDDDIGWFEENV